MRKKTDVRRLTMMALFTALIAVGAFIKIPVPVVPFTLQLLFTTLAGLLFGSRFGACSVGAYICLGLLGLPIFAEGGGFWYLLKPSFGYLPGFLLGSWLCGRMVEKAKAVTWKMLVAASFANLLAVYGTGLAYYYIICNFVLDTPVAMGTLFLYGFVLAVPGDIALCILSACVAKRMRPVVLAMEQRTEGVKAWGH
ncbi:MAG: biotin transporter BioY [Blautia sp.]|jgi:biotin transport system substrate-specific component